VFSLRVVSDMCLILVKEILRLNTKNTSIGCIYIDINCLVNVFYYYPVGMLMHCFVSYMKNLCASNSQFIYVN
jgi:hypothetical protein